MKHYELTQIAQFLSKFSTISSIERVEDMLIKVVFDRFSPLFFDLSRGQSTIFLCNDYIRSKIYQAPFDTLLKKHFSKASIRSIEVPNDNRILSIHVDTFSPYKPLKMSLVFEFTGRNTNAIILDENGVVQEALRHIDSSVSSRSVRVGQTLEPLFGVEFKEKYTQLNFPQQFEDNFEKKNINTLQSLRATKKLSLQKKIDNLKQILNSLDNEQELQNRAKKLYFEADLILANLNSIKAYDSEVVLYDYAQNPHKITLPALMRTPQEGANKLFKMAKKLKQKSSSLHIERESLSSKIEFLQNLSDSLNSLCIQEINILFPKRALKRKESKNEAYETLFFEGFKIMVGKSEKANAQLLKDAKKNDLWFHLKDIQIGRAHV